MKTFMVALAAFGFINTSFAVVIPGWERPTLRAEMKEVVKPKPGLTFQYYLTLNKRDGALHPTSLSFTSEQVIYCVTTPCPRPTTTQNFRIGRIEKDGCGSTVYYASENVNHTEPAYIQLVDHSTRHCEDYKPYRWEMQITGFRFQKKLVGNPEGVVTIQ